MNSYQICLDRILATLLTLAWCPGSVCDAHVSEYAPAFFHDGIPDELVLFPEGGRSIIIGLPAGLPKNPRIIAFSADGRSIYAQTTEGVGRWRGLLRIEFQPSRWAQVPWTSGLGLVRCLAAPDSSHLLLRVSSDALALPKSLEVTPAGVRELSANGPSICIDRGISLPPRGFLSPDGMRTVINDGTGARVLTLQPESVKTIKQSSATVPVQREMESERFPLV